MELGSTNSAWIGPQMSASVDEFVSIEAVDRIPVPSDVPVHSPSALAILQRAKSLSGFRRPANHGLTAVGALLSGRLASVVRLSSVKRPAPGRRHRSTGRAPGPIHDAQAAWGLFTVFTRLTMNCKRPCGVTGHCMSLWF